MSRATTTTRPARDLRTAPGSGRATRPRNDGGARTTFFVLLAVVGVLNLVGLVMVLSASSVQSLQDYGSTWSYFLRQAVWVGLGTVVLAVAMAVDYRRWRRWATPLLVLAFVLLVAVLVPGVGIKVNGARSWLGSGSLRMQPAELAKLALLLFGADLLTRRGSRMGDSRVTLRPVLAVTGVGAFLLMLQPDLGSTFVAGMVVFAVLFVAGAPLARLAGVFTIASGAAVGLALLEPYRRDRLLAFLDPSRDPMNTGYQINQSLMGVASGRLTGVGLGASRAKWGFLPNAHNDFIFAIVSEEMGLFGALLVVGLFLAFAMAGTKAALRAPDRFGTLVAAGVTAWVLAQAFVNIGGVVGVLPITGLTLPFVSAGGTSLVVTMAATGILLNIARQGKPAPA